MKGMETKILVLYSGLRIRAPTVVTENSICAASLPEDGPNYGSEEEVGDPDWDGNASMCRD